MMRLNYVIARYRIKLFNPRFFEWRNSVAHDKEFNRIMGDGGYYEFEGIPKPILENSEGIQQRRNDR